jgi:pimeloyl-ACP methyl ester carboxylesterase
MIRRHLFTGVLLALALTACVPNRMYRRESVIEHPGYSLSFIEFDDQGDLWSPVQVSRALARIKQANENEAGSVVLVFIHGWHHNASPKDERSKGGNIFGFRQLLEETLEVTLQSGERRSVVGVYLAWRGESIRLPLIKELSFYDRASAAGRIARTTATETILKILTASEQNPQTRTILIGHSFGGQIMERALSQAIVGGVLGTREREIRLPTDAVILVNPASQAIYAKQLVEALERSRVKIYGR